MTPDQSILSGSYGGYVFTFSTNGAKKQRCKQLAIFNQSQGGQNLREPCPLHLLVSSTIDNRIYCGWDHVVNDRFFSKITYNSNAS